MTGLKSGSGDDLWGDDAEEETEPDRDDADRPTESSSDQRETDASDGTTAESTPDRDDDASLETDTSTDAGGAARDGQPYVVRRAVQDKSVQFERDERLTFFVHDDVVEGERSLVTDVQATLGRDVPKFDVREAVYRAALRNPDDVLEELLEMGYTTDDE